MKLWVIAIIASISVIASPAAYACGGGKGGNDAAARLLKQQQQQEEQQQQQEEEQTPAAAAPATAAPTDPASLAARDFYTNMVRYLDGLIAQQRQKLSGLDTRIAGLDHRLAMDFTAARADDKTIDDMANSARETMANRPKSARVNTIFGRADLSATSLADEDMLTAAEAITDFQVTAQGVKNLEAVRADMAKAATAFGAVIN